MAKRTSSIILLICLLMMSSCRTHTVVVEHTVHDTLCQVLHQIDSIYLHDSVSTRVETRGDTVYNTVEKLRVQYVNKYLKDSVYIAVIDSVPAPYPVEKEVPMPLSWWDNFYILIGRIASSLVIMAVIAYIIHRKFKK